MDWLIYKSNWIIVWLHGEKAIGRQRWSEKVKMRHPWTGLRSIVSNREENVFSPRRSKRTKGQRGDRRLEGQEGKRVLAINKAKIAQVLKRALIQTHTGEYTHHGVIVCLWAQLWHLQCKKLRHLTFRD